MERQIHSILSLSYCSCRRLDSVHHEHPRGGAGGRHPGAVLRVRRHQEHPLEPGPANGIPQGIRSGRVRDAQTGTGGKGGAQRVGDTRPDNCRGLVLREGSEEDEEGIGEATKVERYPSRCVILFILTTTL